MRLSRLGPVALLVLLWAAPRTPRTAALTTKGAQLVDEAGSTVELHGLNVAGFHSFLSMASSLSAGFDSLSQDWETVLWRIKALGFNAVRLPFTFASLDQHGTPYGRSGCQAATFEQAVRATTPPNRVQSFGDGNSTSSPLLRGYPALKDGACSAGIPNGSVRARFLWAARAAGAAGLYVMPDFHLVRAFGAPDTIIYDPEAFVAAWAALARDLAAIPELEGRLALDFVNEPDGFNLTWSQGSPQRGGVGMTELYLRLMDAVWAGGACRSCLFVVEGTGQSGIRANWGDGFVHNDTYLAEQAKALTLDRLSSAEPFLTAVLDKPYVAQVVISPHFYCPRVTTDNAAFAGAPAFSKWSRSTGAFGTTGYCPPGRPAAACRQFPVVNGEFGTGFEDGDEEACWRSIVGYMRAEGAAADGRHAPIRSWFYWLWNPESDDTSGGIVGPDYRTITPLGWRKLAALTGEAPELGAGLGLKPWWLA